MKEPTERQCTPEVLAGWRPMEGDLVTTTYDPKTVYRVIRVDLSYRLEHNRPRHELVGICPRGSFDPNAPPIAATVRVLRPYKEPHES